MNIFNAIFGKHEDKVCDYGAGYDAGFSAGYEISKRAVYESSNISIEERAKDMTRKSMDIRIKAKAREAEERKHL